MYELPKLIPDIEVLFALEPEKLGATLDSVCNNQCSCRFAGYRQRHPDSQLYAEFKGRFSVPEVVRGVVSEQNRNLRRGSACADCRRGKIPELRSQLARSLR